MESRYQPQESPFTKQQRLNAAAEAGRVGAQEAREAQARADRLAAERAQFRPIPSTSATPIALPVPAEERRPMPSRPRAPP